MKRKSFILLVVLFLLAFSTVCFANDIGNDVKNTVNGATNTLVDGTQNLAEDVRSGIGTAEDTIESGVKNVGAAIMDGASDFMSATDNNYTATRTSTEDDTTVINNTAAMTWTWIAVAIAGIVIVGVVWYYASEQSKH